MADVQPAPTPVANGGWLRAYAILGILGLGGLAVAGFTQNWTGWAAVAAVAVASAGLICGSSRP